MAQADHNSTVSSQVTACVSKIWRIICFVAQATDSQANMVTASAMHCKEWARPRMKIVLASVTNAPLKWMSKSLAGDGF